MADNNDLRGPSLGKQAIKEPGAYTLKREMWDGAGGCLRKSSLANRVAPTSGGELPYQPFQSVPPLLGPNQLLQIIGTTNSAPDSADIEVKLYYRHQQRQEKQPWHLIGISIA